MYRLSNLKIILILLLPYMILAVGAEFMHHHHDGDGCAACAWAGATLSSVQEAPVALTSEVVFSAAFTPEPSLHSTYFGSSASPRAPPVG
jgi:hypothetical protein